MEAKSLLSDNWKMQKQRIKKKTSKRDDFFLRNIVLIEEKKWENIFGELFFSKMVRNTNKNTISIFLFLGWKEHQNREKQKQVMESGKGRTDWKRGRENKQHISGRVFFEPFPHLSPKRKKQREEIHLTKLQTHAKRKYCVWNRAFKKRNLTKRIEFFCTKSEHRNKRFVILSERVKDSENKTTHTKKRKRKNKKETRTFKKRKRTKDTSQQKRWKNDREIRNKAKTKFAIGTRRGRDSENTRRQWKNHQKKEKHKKWRKAKKQRK